MNDTICDKIAYDTRGEAGRQIATMRKRGKHTYGVYPCKRCGKFHITTSSKHHMRKPPKMDKYPIRWEMPVVEEVKTKKKKRRR